MVASLIMLGIFVTVSTVVSARLLALWRRTRALPELLIGVTVACLGPVGFGLLAGGRMLAVESTALAAALTAAGSTAAVLGTISLSIFNWRVYRPDSLWVARMTAAGALVLLTALAIVASSQGFARGEPLGWSQARGGMLSAVMLWGAIEAFRFYGAMRKRLRLGLADPLVTNRFLLWGLSSWAAGQGAGIAVVVQFLLGATALASPVVVLTMSAHGLVSALTMALAFMPPRFYRELFPAAPTPS